MHVCVSVFARTYVYMCLHTRMYIYVFARTYVGMCLHARINVYMNVCM